MRPAATNGPTNLERRRDHAATGDAAAPLAAEEYV